VVGPSPLPALAGTAAFAHVGVLVEDLERAIAAHAGRGPWSVWTHGAHTMRTLEADGAPVEFAFRVAADAGAPQIELIQPLDERGPHAAWMRDRGPGLHHLAYLVQDVAVARRAMREAGFAEIVAGTGQGLDGSGGFAYFDTVATLGYVTEAIERPKLRREPELVLP
jgi:methylmalonyl-CoA/ethylmalonyl-CoA epimerase